MQDGPPRDPLVSVVVPVFEPGAAIEPCIDSLLAQSLPAGLVELIFVDDGSRDATPGRLDALAAAHPHVRVVHEPGSGWAGRPRNVGMDQARGRYVQFVDQDDRLGPEALERLTAMAETNGTDIVIGKVTSDFRGVPHGLFLRDRPTCTVADAPLIDSLTPHKLFRREFLVRHDLRFPEGRRRLEDQLFMVRAYLAGATVSILAAYPCYFYLERPDRANAGSARIDPSGYYGNLREVLDAVLAGTEPGADRDRLLARFLRVELLGRLERDILAGDDDYRRGLVDAVRTTIERWMTPGAVATLAAVPAARLALVRADRIDALARFSERTTALRGHASAGPASWRRGRLEIDIEASIVDPSDRPIRLLAEGGRTLLDPALSEDVLEEPLEVTRDVAAPRLQLFVQSPRDGVMWRVRTRDIRLAGAGDALTVQGRGVIDPRDVAGGGPLPVGDHLLRCRVTVAGLDVWSTVTAEGIAHATGAATADRIVRLEGGDGQLLIRVASTWGPMVDAGAIRRLPSGGRRLIAVLPVGAAPDAAPRSVPIELEGRRGRRVRVGRLTTHDGRWAIESTIGPIHGRLPHGRHVAWGALDGPHASLIQLGTVTVDRVGRVAWVDGGRSGPVAQGRRALRRFAGVVRRVARRLTIRRTGRTGSDGGPPAAR